MSERRFLPDYISLAPPANMRLVRGAEIPTATSVPFEADQGSADLDKAVHAWTGVKTLTSKPFKLQLEPTSSWSNLIQDTVAAIEGHVDNCDFTNYSQLRPVILRSGLERPEWPTETAAKVKKVAKEGIAVAGAFLEVIPKVKQAEAYKDPNQELANLALRSAGLISEWSRAHGAMDPELAYALSADRRKLRGARIGVIFQNLRFAPQWFTEKNGAIVIDEGKAHLLRNSQGHPLKRSKQENRQLFACAFIKHIPLIYRTMAERARQDDLFGSTYAAASQSA